MGENDNYKQDQKKLIFEYEDQLKNGSLEFIPMESFEQIIDYYLDLQKFKKALQACSIAIERYPYSTELKLDKAQILSNLGKYGEAIDILDSASILQPNDEELMLLKGTILSLMGNHKEAIGIYKEAL